MQEQHNWLDIPISAFTVSLGTVGVGNFWATLSREWAGMSLEYVGYAFGILGAVLWTVFAVLYAGKMIFQFKKFLAEWNR